MKKKIIISSLLLMSNLNASYFYKIDLNSKNNNSIIVNNELPSSPIEESAIDENPNSEENINQWAVFLRENSPYYMNDGSGFASVSADNSYQQELEMPPPEFCEFEPCEMEDNRMSVEEIAEILKTTEAVISVYGNYSQPGYLVFPTENGLNNTIKSIRFKEKVKTISGMSNVQVIQENFGVDFAPISSYENLSNLKTVGGSIQIYGPYSESIAGADMSFLRNLESVEDILISAVTPLNLAQINRNLVTDFISISSTYNMPDEDAYWLRDKVADGTLGRFFLYDLENTSLKMFEGLTNLQNVKLRRFKNLTNLNGLESANYIQYLELWHNHAMINLEGLNNLNSAYSISIRYNNNLSSTQGLESLTTAGNVNLSSNALNDLSGLQNLVSVNSLTLSYNDLSNLDGLENLNNINGDLIIKNNTNLTNLNGLQNLETVGGDINLYKTPVEDISGLAGLTNVTGLVILQEREGGFLVKLPSNSYLCKNSGKLRMYTLDGNSWSLNEVCG